MLATLEGLGNGLSYNEDRIPDGSINRKPSYYEGRIPQASISKKHSSYEGRTTQGSLNDITHDVLRPGIKTDGVLNLPRYHPKYTVNKFKYNDGYDNFGYGASILDKGDDFLVARKGSAHGIDDVTRLGYFSNTAGKVVTVEPLHVLPSQRISTLSSEKTQCCSLCCCYCVRPDNCCDTTQCRGLLHRQCCGSNQCCGMHPNQGYGTIACCGLPSNQCCCIVCPCCMTNPCCMTSKCCGLSPTMKGHNRCCGISSWNCRMCCLGIIIAVNILLLLIALAVGLGIGLSRSRQATGGDSPVQFNTLFKLEGVKYDPAYAQLEDPKTKSLSRAVCNAFEQTVIKSNLSDDNVTMAGCTAKRYDNGSVWCRFLIEFEKQSSISNNDIRREFEDSLNKDFLRSDGYFRSDLRELTTITSISNLQVADVNLPEPTMVPVIGSNLPGNGGTGAVGITAAKPSVAAGTDTAAPVADATSKANVNTITSQSAQNLTTQKQNILLATASTHPPTTEPAKTSSSQTSAQISTTRTTEHIVTTVTNQAGTPLSTKGDVKPTTASASNVTSTNASAG